MQRTTLILMAVLTLAVLDGGNVSPGLAESNCVALEISGASGRSVCENNWLARWTWTAPATGPVTFDTEGSDFDLLLTVLDLDGTFQDEMSFNAQQGQKYVIFTWRTNNSIDPGTIVLNWRPSSSDGGSRASNDDFAASVAISGARGRSTGGNVGAGKESGEPDHAGNGGGASAWWTWTAPATGSVTFDTRGSAFNTLLAVYTGDSLNGLTEIASNDDAEAGDVVFEQSEVRFSAQQGQTYHLAVDGYGGATGTVVLNWRPSSSGGNDGGSLAGADDFGSRVAISGMSGRGRGSNTGASIQSGEPNHAGNSGGASVWWTWTAPTTEPVVFNTHGSDFDTLLAIYTGNSLNDLTVAASNDDTDDRTLQSTVRFNAQQGQTYHITVDGYGGATGAIVLNWQPASDSENPDVTLHLSQLTQDTSQGKVIIVEYEGPEFDEADLSVWVGDTSVESSFVDDQIHFMLPLTESGETLLEFDFGDISSDLYLDITEAPTIADPPSYITGVIDDLVLQLDSYQGTEHQIDYDALLDAEDDLATLSDDEMQEMAVFLRQNIEPILTPDDENQLSPSQAQATATGTAPGIGLSHMGTVVTAAGSCAGNIVSAGGNAIQAVIAGGAVHLIFPPTPLGFVVLGVATYALMDGLVDLLTDLKDVMSNCPQDASGIAGLLRSVVSIENLLSKINYLLDKVSDSLGGTFDTAVSRFDSMIAELNAFITRFSPIEVSITAGPGPVMEGTTATFTVAFDPPPASDIRLHYTVKQTGAYVSSINVGSKIAVITSGTTTGVLTVRTEPDQIPEEAGAVRVVLNNADGYTVGTPVSAVVVVTDDDDLKPEATITAGPSPVMEGTAATFTVAFDPAPASEIALYYTVSQTGAYVSPGDLGNKIRFVDEGASTVITIAVPTEDDQVIEEAGAVRVVLNHLRNADGYITRDMAKSAEVMVSDNDGLSMPEVSIAAESSPVTEGTAARFTVAFSPAPVSDVTLRYTVTQRHHTSRLSGEYVSPTHLGNKMFRVSGGTAAVTITVPTEDDQKFEGGAWLTVTLASDTGYKTGVPSRATVLIQDDDTCIQATQVEESDRTGYTITSTKITGWFSNAITLRCWISFTGTNPNFAIAHTPPPYCPSLVIYHGGQSLATVVRQQTERAAEDPLLEWTYEHITCPLYMTQAHEQCLSGSVPDNALDFRGACER